MKIFEQSPIFHTPMFPPCRNCRGDSRRAAFKFFAPNRLSRPPFPLRTPPERNSVPNGRLHFSSFRAIRKERGRNTVDRRRRKELSHIFKVYGPLEKQRKRPRLIGVPTFLIKNVATF